MAAIAFHAECRLFQWRWSFFSYGLSVTEVFPIAKTSWQRRLGNEAVTRHGKAILICHDDIVSVLVLLL